MASSVPVPEVCSLGRLVKGVGEKKERDKQWNGEIVATASTGQFWEPDREYELKLEVNELKRKFHQNRHLRAKCLPSDVKESEVWQMLSDFPVSVITMTNGHGAAGSACAYLEDPEMLEDWDKDQDFMLRGNKIPVMPSSTDMLLCIARIPLSYTPAMFDGLVKSFGEVSMSFLMISEKTGESKGYGFVEYKNKDTALNAKTKLSSLNVKDSGLWVEFVDSSLTTFESLHSKCLYVNNLPPNYCDMADFRKRLSVVANPPYCQIALKNGRPLSWGLVEFSSAEDAEATFNKLSGTEFDKPDGKDGSPRTYKMAYYIPGVRAIHLYLKLLEDEPAHKGNGFGLLPNPPPPSVYQTFENLRKQNPVFAQNVQKILLSELFGTGTSENTESMANPNADQFAYVPDISMLNNHQRLIFDIIKRDVEAGSISPQDASSLLMRDVFGFVPMRFVPAVPQLSPTQGMPFGAQFVPQPTYIHPSMIPVHNWSIPPPVSPPLPHMQQPVPMGRSQAVWPVSVPETPTSNVNSPESLPSISEESQMRHGADLLSDATTQTPIFHSPGHSPLDLSSSLSVAHGSPLNGMTLNSMGKPTQGGGMDGLIPYGSDLSRNYGQPNGFDMNVGGEGDGLLPTPGNWAVPSKVRMTPSPQRLSKRKLSSGILPTPEASPKGNYIGQHSQGIGGHYSDSYFKRQKKNDDDPFY